MTSKHTKRGRRARRRAHHNTVAMNAWVDYVRRQGARVWIHPALSRGVAVWFNARAMMGVASW